MADNQSSISEVKDQLSLDFADEKYLNVVTANLGINRPLLGFSDDVWRALVKVLAIQYKQIRNKFEDVLTIILGPKITQCGALLVNASAGDTLLFLVNTAQFPQVGTMVLDEGLAVEETIEYTYIDRYSNAVFLKTALVNDHLAIGTEWESGVISPVSPTSANVSVFDVSGFPDPLLQSYTVCVGRGTPYELSGVAVDRNLDARYLELFSLTTGSSGLDAVFGQTASLTPIDTQSNVYYLNLEDVSFLTESKGFLQTQLAGTLTATGGTTQSVTVTGPITADVYGGFWVLFTGNVTATLANKIGYVIFNSTTTFTFDNILPAPPAAGDTFSLLSNFQYIRAIEDTNSILMPREFPDLNFLTASSQFTVIRPTTTVAIAQVQVKGTGWDVFQSHPHLVEILLPPEFLINDLRTASYVRQTGMSGTSTTDQTRAIGDLDISVVTTSGMPIIGTLTHVASGKQYAYYNPQSFLVADALAGDTTITVTDTSQFEATGTLNINGDLILYTVTDPTTFAVAPLPNDVRIGDEVRDEKILRIPHGLLATVASTDTIDFYTNYDSGDVWNIPDVWPGPYVWDFFAETHKKETVPNNSITTVVSGPSTLAVDSTVTASVLEITDASVFPTAVPYDILLGENSGNLETLAVQEISLRSRTYTTTNGTLTAGDTQILMTALAGPTGPENTFPDGGPYRVVVEPFTSNQEVLIVSGTATGPNRLLLSTPAVNTHSSGVSVVLLADLLRISPTTGDDHVGSIMLTDRQKFYGPTTQEADLVRPVYTSLSLALAGTDFAVDNGVVIWNFGERVVKASSRLVSIASTSITLENTTAFPTVYPYTIYLDVGAGPLLEEVLHVTNNNTGTGVLTVSHPPVFSHTVKRLVEFRPGPEEIFSYTTRVSSTLSFMPSLLIENTHHKVEYVAPSIGPGFPRNTGYDFPLRLPVTIEDRIRYVVDLVRSAGVQVLFIRHR